MRTELTGEKTLSCWTPPSTGQVEALGQVCADTPWSGVPTDVANGWILTVEDGRRMILDSRATIGPAAGEGVVGTMTSSTGQTTVGSIAHLWVDRGSTEMGCGPERLPHVAPRPTPQRAIGCASGKALKCNGPVVVQLISPETCEDVQITTVVLDVVR